MEQGASTHANCEGRGWASHGVDRPRDLREGSSRPAGKGKAPKGHGPVGRREGVVGHRFRPAPN
jgi:hypothetical protein